jgi:2',3'-cyclic-nucleotide 2'-phosphodiesterase (5'-nucleotidase family)
MIRKAVRFTMGALVALCLYLPYSNGAYAQKPQGAQTTSASPTASPGGSKTPAQTTAAAPSQELRSRASENLIDASLPEDPELKKLIAPYRTKVDELNVPIGKLSGNLKKTGMGGGTLGNFVADALRVIAQKKLGSPVLLAVINTSGLRKNEIVAGSLSSSDIFELLPFENALVTLDLTGEQLLSFMALNVRRRNAQSGARIIYRNNPEKKQNEMVGIKLSDGRTEREIDPQATYTIATIDYLVKRGGEYIVLQQGKNLRPLGVTMRDAVLEYIKAETAAGRAVSAGLDGRFKNESGSEDEAQ